MESVSTVGRDISAFISVIRLAGLLYNAERDLLAVAKYLVMPRP